MTDHDLDQLLLRRFSAVQTPWGRCQLRARSGWKRFSWRFIVKSALAVKRGLDILFSLTVLICLAPVFLVVALLIKLEDRGPVLFAQTRVGRFGKQFKMYKFRSMRPDAEKRLAEVLSQNQHQTGVTFKIKQDPRITKIGSWLRKYSIDEFPQFYNVLRGDMSLVGPRPPLPREVALYSLADRRRLEVTPGLTCFWQIGGRSELDFPQQVRLDLEYIESQSFWVDIKILFRTVPAVLLGKGAC